MLSRPCSFQPRKDFSAEALRELADSIKEQGIVQPLIVREAGGFFELIAGERRWRASQLVGLVEVPVIVRKADDRAVLELALIENLQRENLNPIEEAHGYSQLIEQFQLKQEEVALKVAGVCDETRLWMRELFTELAREAGAADPEALAKQLVILYDGATVSAQMDHDPKAARSARAIAEGLLDAATARGRRR